MTNTNGHSSISLDTPACEKCGGPTRLFGIEPHATYARMDVHTYACDACDSTQVVLTPLPAVVQQIAV